MAECYNKIWIEKQQIMVDCGKCLNCIQNKKREIALRAVQEMSDKKNIYFATLTYDELHIIQTKDGRTISKTQIRNYIKRVRQQMRRRGIDEKLIYVASGEYGEETKRPHYHVTIASDYMIADIIKNKWNEGNVHIEKGTKASIFYTVGYSEKKLGIDDWKYNDYSELQEPFIKRSQGQGKKWIEKNAERIGKENYYLNTVYGKMRLPKYYKDYLKETGRITEEDTEEIKKEVEKKYQMERDYLINKYGKKENGFISKANGKYYNEEFDEIVEKIREQQKQNAIAKIKIRKEKRKLL